MSVTAKNGPAVANTIPEFNWDGEDLAWLRRTTDSATFKACANLHARLRKLECRKGRDSTTTRPKERRDDRLEKVDR